MALATLAAVAAAWPTGGGPARPAAAAAATAVWPTGVAAAWPTGVGPERPAAAASAAAAWPTGLERRLVGSHAAPYRNLLLPARRQGAIL